MHITLSHFPPHRSNKPVLTHHLPYWNSIWVRMCVCVCAKCGDDKFLEPVVNWVGCGCWGVFLSWVLLHLRHRRRRQSTQNQKGKEPERAREEVRHKGDVWEMLESWLSLHFYTCTLSRTHTHTHTLSWLFPKQLPEFTWLPGTERVERTFSGIFHALPGRAKKWRDRGTEPQLPVTHVLPSLLCSISFSLPLLPFFACPRFFFLSTCPRKETISIVN